MSWSPGSTTVLTQHHFAPVNTMTPTRNMAARPQDSYPLGEKTDLGDITIERTAVAFKRTSCDGGSGGQELKQELHDLRKPAQSFRSLYRAVVDAVNMCGACSRSDLALIPAFSGYSHWQLERALEAARLHGYLKTVGRIPASHPDAPQNGEVDAPWPLIYDIDPAGPLLDRNDTQRLVQRALVARSPLEIRWFGH